MDAECRVDDHATQAGDSEQEGIPRHASSRHIRESKYGAGHFGGYVRRSNTVQSEPPYSPSPTGSRDGNVSRNRQHDQADSIFVANGRTPKYGQQGSSLAGPQDFQSQSRPTDQHQPYVESGYGELNPAYHQPGNLRPVWALSKPLPRVIRRGMAPSQDEIDATGDDPEPGEEAKGSAKPTESELEKGVRPSYKVHRQSQNLKDSSQKREQNYVRKHSKKLEHPSAAGQDSQTQSFGPIKEVPSEEGSEGKEGDLGIPRPPVRPLNQNYPVETRTRHENENEDGDEKEEEEDSKDPDNSSDCQCSDDEDQTPLTWIVSEIHNHHTHWSVLRTKIREPLAETLAVIVFLTLGICLDLARAVSASNSPDTAAWGWGLATMTGVYIAGGISGGHLNPAVTIMLHVFRGFPRRKIPGYVLAQLLGAYTAALISFGIYRNFIVDYLARNGTAVISDVERAFITELRRPADAAAGFFAEFVASAFLAVVVLALGDDSNASPGAGMNAFILGLVVGILVMAFAPSTGAGMNPIRDLGPRLALLTVGTGGGRLFADPWWVYGAWCGPVIGMLVGATAYDVAIFVGGESPINYPRRRIVRTGAKAKNRWKRRMGRMTKKKKKEKKKKG